MRKMYMFDYARQRFLHREELACLFALLGKLGYEELGFYVEGAFLPEGQAGAIRKEVITASDAEWILQEAQKNNLSVLPMTNVLYHMEHYLCQERYAHLRRRGKQERYLVNFEAPEAVPFAMGIIHSLAAMFHTDTIQIGLDEFPFTKEEIHAIGKYIEQVTTRMLAEGLRPAVWGDMFWMEQSLTAYLPREVEIHDWNYYGHRSESLRYFRAEGFRQVIAVPSDNGWEGFTGCQRTSGYLKSRMDIPVDSGEIEAFLQDAEAEKADGGMIANWSSSVGTSIWSALVPAARAALWLNGTWKSDEAEETQVEKALFGRVTPYTRIVQRLRALQMHMSERWHIRLPQDALYRLNCMLTLLNMPADFWCGTIALYREAIPQMERELEAWKPATESKRYAHGALWSVVTNVRAALALMEASQSRVLYRKAAEVQFTDRDAFRAQLSG